MQSILDGAGPDSCMSKEILSSRPCCALLLLCNAPFRRSYLWTRCSGTGTILGFCCGLNEGEMWPFQWGLLVICIADGAVNTILWCWNSRNRKSSGTANKNWIYPNERTIRRKKSKTWKRMLSVANTKFFFSWGGGGIKKIISCDLPLRKSLLHSKCNFLLASLLMNRLLLYCSADNISPIKQLRFEIDCCILIIPQTPEKYKWATPRQNHKCIIYIEIMISIPLAA